MALTTTEEAQLRQLITQQAALLSLAGNEATITSKLGATKVNLGQLPAASEFADADLLLVRQGGIDKGIAGSVAKTYIGTGKANSGANADITSMTALTAPTVAANPVRAVDIQAQTVTAFTTGGTSTAYTLTPTPASAANTANQRFRVKFNAAAGTTPTLAVSGQAALNLKYKDSAGTKQAITATQVPINWVSDVENDGTDWVVLDVPPSAAIPAASTTVSGIVELATSAEAIAGSDAARAITPATLFGGLNASGTAPIYACRAWVNFNGTGVVAIRASGNVSSITDNGVGEYTVNFTTAMPDADYSHVGAVGHNNSSQYFPNLNAALALVAPTDNAFRVLIRSPSTGSVDATYVNISVFR